ncbi:HEXXH motif domain-containing protein [Streptomonospora alba]|uniref:HEXXH motif domain-containing protein n=1 Tax=Streptomonospora alba TaxID=183763 RepID=UPI00069AE7C7|nr:HEXXH motif domain-containing protein [Streptomonospora alba]
MSGTAAPSAPSGPLRRHTLPAEQIAALARGHGGAEAVAGLRAGQLSKRLVLLRAVGEAARDTGRAGHWQRGYDLLARVQREAPDTVAAILLSPQVGEWAAHTLRRLRGAGAEPGIDADVAHIGAVAAAAAITAGADFAVEVPLRHGFAALPGLGRARVTGVQGVGEPEAGQEARETALLRGEDGCVAVESPSGETVELPVDLRAPAPGWEPVRRLECTADELRLSVLLDDLDPYRDPHGLGAASRLAEQGRRTWQEGLDGAWRLLVRDHPRHAEGIAAGLRALVPLDASSSGRGRNATSADSFGATMMAPPSDTTALALGLLHEFQHAKLNALLDLTALYTDPGQPRHYAPWRADPRPLPALLHGIYAHAAVAEFWQVRRSRSTGRPAADFAHFEFARWRAQTVNAAATAADSGLLTAVGEDLVGGIRTRLEELEGGVPEPVAHTARAAACDHALLWRLRNLRPDPTAVEELAAAWRRGERAGPRSAGCVIRPAEAPPGIDARMELRALLLRDPPRFAEAAAGRTPLAEAAPEATAADLALISGRADEARSAYSSVIAGASLDCEPHSAWAGLALAAAASTPSGCGSAPHARPEVAMALYAALRRGGADPAPAELLTWLPDLGPDPAPTGVHRAAAGLT